MIGDLHQHMTGNPYSLIGNLPLNLALRKQNRTFVTLKKMFQKFYKLLLDDQLVVQLEDPYRQLGVRIGHWLNVFVVMKKGTMQGIVPIQQLLPEFPGRRRQNQLNEINI